MTNTMHKVGAHRTEEPFGVVIKAHPHHRGHCSRLVGEINARSWRDRADAARSDAPFRRMLRAVEIGLMTKPRKPLETCKRCRGVGEVPPADPSQTGLVTCPTCNGTGKV